MECQRLRVLEGTILDFIHLKIELPDTKSLVCTQKSTEGTSTRMQILFALPLIKPSKVTAVTSSTVGAV